MKSSRDVILAYIAQISTFVISIFSSVLIARYLGPDGKGVYSVLIRLGGVAQAFSQWGVQESLLPIVRQNKGSLRKLSGSALVFCFCIAIVISVLIISIYPFVSSNILKELQGHS